MATPAEKETPPPPPSSPRYYVHLGLLGTQMVNALYGVLTERMLGKGGAGTHPLVFSFWRDIFAWPLLQVAAALVHKEAQQTPERRDMPRITVQGFLGVFCNQALFLIGIGYAGATMGAIVNLTLPLFAAGISVALGLEAMRWHSALGIALAVGGGLIMKVGGGKAIEGSDMGFGIFLLTIGALASAVYYIMQRPMLQRYPPLLLTAWEYVVGFAVMGVVGFMAVPDLGQWKLSQEAYLPLAFSVVFNSCAKYALNAWCNKQAGAVVVTLWATTAPVLTAALSWFMLGKPLQWSHMGGIPILMGTGLYMWGKQMGQAGTLPTKK